MSEGTILDKIVTATRTRVARAKAERPLVQWKEDLQPCTQDFYAALAGHGMGFICEVKKASPSKGVIAEDFPYLQIAQEYEAAGAAAISVLTEPDFFQGNDAYLLEIAGAVGIPVLRKDFIIDEYQIYEARALGAAAILLICAILDDDQLRRYRRLAESLGMDALVEAHDEQEIKRSLAAGASIVGVNNRDLKTFRVDTATSVRLRTLVPPEVLFVSESGIARRQDVATLEQADVNAVLVGETLMRSADKKQALAGLRGVKVKLCGLRTVADAEAANAAMPDYIGMIFAPGRRQVSHETARAIRQALKPEIQAVGVFVHADPQEIVDLVEQGVIQLVQLHGGEAAAYRHALKKRLPPGVPILCAVPVGDTAPMKPPHADLVLFDAPGGGSGSGFDWGLLAGHTNYFLAGGLTPENVQAAIAATWPLCVDVSSGTETDGVKDARKMREFCQKAREMTP